jgi:hypothetical protein
VAEIQRASQSDPDWAAAPPPERTEPALRPGRPGDPLRALNALDRMAVEAKRLNRYAGGAVDVWLKGLRAADAVAAIVLIQDLRRALAETEAALSRQVGRDEMAPTEGVLADGRQFSVMKGAERKAWRHDQWQTDVRREILSGIHLESVLDAETGEPIDLVGLLAAAQRVHSSAPPKVTALRPLGLKADDYAETFPGPYAVKVTRTGD